MITGRDFIFISSIEWGFLWQGHQEIATRLAASGNRVLYIENMGVRSPTLGDASRIAGRLRNWAAARGSKGVREVAPNIHMCAPIVCPPFGSSFRSALNRYFFLPALKRIASKLGFRDPIIWNYLPTDASAELIRLLVSPKGLVVYHCVADFAQLTPQTERLKKSEAEVLSLSDLVLASCSQLAQSAAVANDHVYLTSHGVNLEAFPYTDGLNHPDARPAELQALTGPIIGYVGGIHLHLDLDLIRKIALLRPDWTWVLVGSVQVPVTEFQNIVNIKFLGARPHSQLVNYIRHFDVCTVPYANTEATATVVPTKINEYLAVGKAVVATNLPTILEFNNEHKVLNVVSTEPGDFIAGVEAALLSNNDKSLAERRRALAEKADWRLQLERISEVLQERLADREATLQLGNKGQ